MQLLLIIIIIALAVLSLAQRIVPWVFYSRFKENKRLENLFELFAISAFTSLFVYNVENVSAISITALFAALIVALKTKNLSLTIVTAILVYSVSLLM